MGINRIGSSLRNNNFKSPCNWRHVRRTTIRNNQLHLYKEKEGRQWIQRKEENQKIDLQSDMNVLVQLQNIGVKMHRNFSKKRTVEYLFIQKEKFWDQLAVQM